MTKAKKILSLFIISSLVFSFQGLAAQKSASEIKKEMQEKINKADKEYSDAQEKKLYYDNLSDELSGDIDYYNGIISQLDSDIRAKNTEITEINAKLATKEDNFEQRLRALHHRGPTNYLDLVFGAENFSDFLYRVTLVTDIVNHDKSMITEISALKDEVTAAKTEIEAKRSEQQSAKDTVVAQQEEYDALAAKQKSFMNEISADKAEYKKQYEKAVKQMEEETRKFTPAITTKKTYTGSGKFQWPVPAGGTVTCRFGYRTDPAPSNHTGIDIALPTGNAIVAANSGTVSTVVGNSSGYGKYLIINHGDGSSTLYAHTSKIYVTVGQKVSRGETIAAVGSTGWSTGPHLHFEVIINGKKVNPEAYLY